MQPIYRNTITYVEPFIPRTARAICGSIIVGVALAALAFYVFCRRKKEQGAAATSPPGDRALPPPDVLDLKNPDTIHGALRQIKGPERCELRTIFHVNEHPYRACSPLRYINENIDQRVTDRDRKMADIQWHMGEFLGMIRDDRIVVNLLSHKEREIGLFKSQFDEFKTKQDYHDFPMWEEEQEVPTSSWDSLFKTAKAVADAAQKSNGQVFVFCVQGTKKTAAFIALIELYRHPTMLQQDVPTIRQFLFNTLLKIGCSSEGRYPHLAQLKQLFSENFIDWAKRIDIQKTGN